MVKKKSKKREAPAGVQLRDELRAALKQEKDPKRRHELRKSATAAMRAALPLAGRKPRERKRAPEPAPEPTPA